MPVAVKALLFISIYFKIILMFTTETGRFKIYNVACLHYMFERQPTPKF